ncbi:MULTISPECIES: type II toxin-antitoxin system VapC family toxin [unclassified Archaeoglobus]|jgi:hypothetical protein|uniref:type II toxin-antitoxin system VapC family toxin n=1 Tax=unclassified Archaeoglobus TaxID=2643606 RepID=UPI0025C6C0BA|nr:MULTISPECIES: type II toxin-antitoxin system VapC family toxin [unclassified Archaeoglobus]
MIVFDTSVVIDALLPKLGDRSRQASEALKAAGERAAVVYAPRIFKIELASVLSRRKSVELVKDVVSDIAKWITLIPESELFDVAYNLSYTTKSRAVDLYFIAAAKLTNSILLTNDRVMAINAKKAGIEAYYLLEEFEAAMKRIAEL